MEAPDAFHVVKLQARAGALDPELARAEARAALLRERRAAALEELVGAVAKREGYTVHESALDRVAVDPNAPPQGHVPPLE